MKGSLFEPIKINGLNLRNRIIMPAMLTHFASINGEVTDRLIAYHSARAEGGVGLIIPEAIAVAKSGLSYHRGLSISNDKYVKGLEKLVRAVHARGGRIGAQLGHAGRFAQPAVSGMSRPLISFIPDWCAMDDSHVMDSDEIHELVEQFIAGAIRAAEAGFDLVEIHGAHGYLIGEFLSPFFNRRADEWGGSLENRMRFPLLVLAGIRKTLGESFPVSFRLSSSEYIPGGIELQEAIKIARLMAENSVNLIQVSAGIIESNRFTGPPPCLPMGWNATNAGKIRSAVKDAGTLVSVSGRIHSREAAESILSSGLADLVAGRGLIADPCLPNKLASGNEKSVTPCLSCNEGCIGSIAAREPLKFAVNPHVGLELLPESKTGTTRMVIVVGGGIAGMEAALTASRRGHSVTLLEKEDKLGGLLNLAGLPPHEDIFFRLLEHMEYALGKAGVEIVTDTAPTAEQLRDMKADVILMATGSTPLVPDFLKDAPTVSAARVLNGEAVGHRVLILGGGLVGAETAEFLALQDKDVSILELRDAIAPDMQGRARMFLLETLAEHNVKFLTNTEIISVSASGDIRVKDKWGNQRALPRFDTLIMALGYR